MNKSELNEIRRRLNAEQNGAIMIRGCYVEKSGEIISTFHREVARMPMGEAEKYLMLFRRVLSLTEGRGGMEINFDYHTETTDELRLLMDLCSGKFSEDEYFNTFCDSVRGSFRTETNYLILMMNDVYDVPVFNKNHENQLESNTIFNYIVTCVCPVKPQKSALAYSVSDQTFVNREGDMLVGSPEFGFMYPTFDERTGNIYSSAYATRDANDPHEEIISSIFNTDKPMTAPETKATFNDILIDSLSGDCDYDLIQSVDTQLRDMINEQKKDKHAAPLTVNKRDMAFMLENTGIETDRIDAFEEAFDEEFGAVASINAKSIIDSSAFEVRTPDVVIKTKPDKSDLIETRVIDGMKYILIRAEEGVEVNGMNIKIN